MFNMTTWPLLAVLKYAYENVVKVVRTIFIALPSERASSIQNFKSAHALPYYLTCMPYQEEERIVNVFRHYFYPTLWRWRQVKLYYLIVNISYLVN